LTDPPRETVEQRNVIHREITQLGILIVGAVLAFLFTRAVAANNREANLRDAGEWYARGERALAAARLDDAVDAFRRATVRNRLDRRYMLALARALEARHDEDAARSVLLTLRESAPEDPEINLQLARLAAARHDVTETVRFYHYALYAPWPSADPDARRRSRLELVRFLLENDQRSQAVSELVATTADLPNTVEAHLETGRLFVAAGDDGHALDQFQRALRLAPRNQEALAGAAEAAAQLGNDRLAETYRRRLPPP